MSARAECEQRTSGDGAGRSTFGYTSDPAEQIRVPLQTTAVFLFRRLLTDFPISISICVLGLLTAIFPIQFWKFLIRAITTNPSFSLPIFHAIG